MHLAYIVTIILAFSVTLRQTTDVSRIGITFLLGPGRTGRAATLEVARVPTVALASATSKVAVLRILGSLRRIT